MNTMTKNVLITGGTGALGKMVVQQFLENDYQVITTYIADREIRDLLEFVGDRKDHLDAIRVDVTDEKSLDELTHQIEKKYGYLNSLVCLVGGYSAGTLTEEAGDVFDDLMTLNAKSFLLTCNATLSLLKRGVKQHKGEGWSHIVGVAARPALDPVKGIGIYAASKAAVVSLIKTLSKELLEENIAVNGIAPSTIDTPANRKNMAKVDPKKWVTPQQVADTIYFLSSNHSNATSGAIVPLYGKA